MPDDLAVELQLDPHTAVVAVTHDPKLDDMVLLEALKSPAFYVGALGSRANTAKRKERLALFDLSTAEIERLHGPVGLDIGSRTPAEIAVSILAEIIQERHATPAGAPEPRPAAPAVAVAVDPVCGMGVAVTDASLHLDVDGERHWFCCESCREKFAAEHAVSG
jgi:xanthine dehydrogenase accessory factor